MMSFNSGNFDRTGNLGASKVISAIASIDKGEYDFEGAMARTQLQTIYRNAKTLIDTLKSDENMPEWVQSKITLAQAYIASVSDYLQSRKELGEAKKMGNPCWKGYKAYGMKKKNGKQVPNCVPVKEEVNDAFEQLDEVFIVCAFRIALRCFKHSSRVRAELFGKKFKKLQLLCIVQKLELTDKFGSDAASVGFAFLR
jgi:hypothetical protein